MPCEWYRLADGTTVHVSRGRQTGGKVCPFCRRRRVEKLCDFPVGKNLMGEELTCDAGMCNSCATTLGAQNTDIGNGVQRLGDTFDVCPTHRSMSLPKEKAPNGS